MHSKKHIARRSITIGLLSAVCLPDKWLRPVITSVILPAHAQTSTLDPLCMDGTSTWLMSDYQENGVQFNQGSPQSQVEITISGSQIDLVTDWCVINSDTNSESRGRVTDSGSVNLNSGEASSTPVGNPVASPTHGAVQNLANNLAQTFTLDCAGSGSFLVRDTSNIYSFRLTRVS